MSLHACVHAERRLAAKRRRLRHRCYLKRVDRHGGRERAWNDADLRRPQIADLLGIPATPGLSDILAGAATLESALIRTAELPDLYVLPAAIAHICAAELFESQNWQALISQIRAQFSMVLFDAPPIALVADYELIQLACDGAMVVVRPDHTKRQACTKALEIVPKEKLLGVVVNGFNDWWLWKTDSYAYYRQ